MTTITAEAWPSHPYEARCPFDYHPADVAELAPFLGRGWAICRDTPANRARYTRCITQRQYAAAKAAAIEARGYARPAEKVIRDLMCLVERLGPADSADMADEVTAALRNAETILAKARVP